MFGQLWTMNLVLVLRYFVVCPYSMQDGRCQISRKKYVTFVEAVGRIGFGMGSADQEDIDWVAASEGAPLLEALHLGQKLGTSWD